MIDWTFWQKDLSLFRAVAILWSIIIKVFIIQNTDTF